MSLDRAVMLTYEIIGTITCQTPTSAHKSVLDYLHSLFTSLGWMFDSYYIVSFMSHYSQFTFQSSVATSMLQWTRHGPHRIFIVWHPVQCAT